MTKKCGQKYRKDPGFGTIAVHGGEEGRFAFSPSSTPIYQTSTFTFDSAEEGGEVEKGEREGFVYTRIGNPTVKAFEDKMALLEGGESCVSFSSGIAALSAVFLELLKPGDEVLSSSQIYSGSKLFFAHILQKLGCMVRRFGPYDDLKKVIPALVTEQTRLIFFETPSNPELSIVDIGLIAGLAKKHGLVSVVDNTFATPYLQRPIESGIDCVVHSATKYIGGHGDAIGGVVVSSKEFISGLRPNILQNLGACLSPFNAWLFLRGLKTLHLRMERHCRTAGAVAEFLAGHPKVKTVLFPGLKTHPGHPIAKKQMSGFGGMVSLRLENSRACRKFINGLRLCKKGVSLGDAGTLALHYASMFHPKLSDASCRKIGVDPTLIRISTGLEDAEDIVEDLSNSLSAL
ncbi:MAG: trans-sulfuration enzyme family protein [Acidobacteriota bacterium]